jgi:hypothetical protein
MKKLFFLLPVFFIAFLSCNNKKDNGGSDGPGIEETSKSIIGKWKVIEMNMEGMDEEEKEDAEKNATIEFRKDGSYTSKDSDGTEDGDYDYDKEKSTITMEDVEFKISWRGKNMVMKGPGGNVVLSRSGSAGLSDNRDDEDMDNSRVTSIAGKWRITDYTSPDGEKPSADELRAMRSSTIEFDRDGSYIAVTKNADGESDTEYGSYTFDAKAKTLETVDDKKNERQSFDVQFRGKDKMVVTSNEGKITLEKN